MSYHRIEPYVWNDESNMHLWSHLREGDTGWEASIRIDLKIFDQIVIDRFCDLIEEGRVPPNISAAIRKMGGKYRSEMQRAARQEKPNAGQ